MYTGEVTQTLLDFSESVLHYVRTDFNDCSEDDLQEQCEGLLQYAMLLDSIHPYHSFEELIDALRQVLSAMSHARDHRAVLSQRGRPRVAIDDEQLKFLVERILLKYLDALYSYLREA